MSSKETFFRRIKDLEYLANSVRKANEPPVTFDHMRQWIWHGIKKGEATEDGAIWFLEIFLEEKRGIKLH